MTPTNQPSAAATRRQEISRRLTAHYPLVHRIAYALCGTEPLAAAVTKTVFTQSLAVLERWSTDAEAANWFLHHTLLEARHVRSTAATWTWCDGECAKAWAALPFQQKEAFLLALGEKLDSRRIGIAMDCSITAAGNHLAAAAAAMKKAAGNDYDALVQKMTAAYLAPPPPANLVIAHATRQAIQRRRLRQIAAVLLIIFTVGLAYLGWRIYGMLDY